MIRLGITGGIGSGKSVVSKVLRLMGIPVYDCDSKAKELMRNDPDLRKSLIGIAGKDVYNDDGGINVKYLSSFLFSNKGNRALVDSVVHPCVKSDFLRWADERDEILVGVESAILFEAGMNLIVDKTVMVYAPEPLRVTRVMKRNGCSQDEAMARIHAQMPDEKKKLLADFVICNDDSEPVLLQLEKMIKQLYNNYQ